MEGSRMGAGTGASRKASEKMRKLIDEASLECRQIADRFGFPYFHLAFRTVAPPGLPLQVFIDGGPEGFRDIYDSQLGFANDPVLRRAMTTIAPFPLRDAIGDDDREAQGMLRHCQRLGINDGLVVPLHGPCSSHGMLSLTGSAPMPQTHVLREEMLRQAQWLSLAMFSRTTSALFRNHESNVRRQLTARQRKALTLAADGKVLSEIAGQLSVHPSTARYLVARAAEKLGVETRIEAIVRMAALGDFFHGLHPGALTQSSIYFAFPPKPKR